MAYHRSLLGAALRYRTPAGFAGIREVRITAEGCSCGLVASRIVLYLLEVHTRLHVLVLGRANQEGLLAASTDGFTAGRKKHMESGAPPQIRIREPARRDKFASTRRPPRATLYDMQLLTRGIL